MEDGDVKVNAMSEGLLQSLHSPSPYCHELSLYLLSQFLPVLPQASITKVGYFFSLIDSMLTVSQVLSHLSDLASAHQSFSLTLALCHVLGQLASLHFYDKVQVRLGYDLNVQLYYTVSFSGSINISVLFFPSLRPSLACKTPCAGIFQGFCGSESVLCTDLTIVFPPLPL